MNAVLAGVAAYVLIQFLIGLWVARRISTEADFINAGRTIGPVLGAFTVFATWFGAEAIVGAGGAVYSEGLSGASLDPGGYAVALMIAGVLLAAPLWRKGYVTFGDFFRDRFSPGVERLAVLMILPGALIWAAAQIRAFGQIMGSAADLPVILTITVAAVLVIVYTSIGGLLADAMTDMVQGIAIMIGLGVLAVLVVADMGGLNKALAAVPPERLSPVGADLSAIEVVEAWAIPIFGTLVSIELISRMLAARSAQVARNACMMGGLLYFAVGLIPVLLGLVGPVLSPGLDEAGQIVPALAEKYLPTLLYVVFVGAVISAILSTVDSALLASGAVLSHNVIQPVSGELSDRQRLWLTRGATAVLGAVAYAIALPAQSIGALIETASAFGSAGLAVTALFGLFTPIGGRASAYAALVTGAGVWATGELAGLTAVPYVSALVAAATAYLLVFAVERIAGSASSSA